MFRRSWSSVCVISLAVLLSICVSTADAHAFWLDTLKVAGGMVFCLAGVYSDEASERLCEAVVPLERPPGSPNASDVIMRSLGLRKANKKSPHDTMQALDDFHVTRLEWAYITNKNFIEKVKASGRVFGGAAAAPSYHPENKDADWFETVVIRDADGKPIMAPWKRTWNRTLWGCANSPEYERGYVEYLKGYIDAGAEVMQRDEPGANYNATSWGGCFDPNCMREFRRYLKENTTEEERHELGIEDLEEFDYSEHVKKQGAPIGDKFSRWDGGKLKKLFVDFQMQSSVAFHERTRKVIDEYAGRHVPFSCNNGAHRWTPIELPFEWFFGELSYRHARPEYLYDVTRAAAQRGKIQVVTMPKKGDRKNLDEWERRTRQTIATAYACGQLCMVPWDTFMPRDQPRYFGTPLQYADLFGFVRANAQYLDGYEDAAAVGKQIDDKRWGDKPPLVVEGGTGDVSVFVRAQEGKRQAPVVVHLVEWDETSEPFTLKMRTPCFFGDKPVSVKLMAPPKYNKAAHNKAEQSGDYAGLSEAVEIESSTAAGVTTVKMPALSPWGILVVSPKD